MVIGALLDPLLDASIVLSFDRTGFQRHARRFRDEDLYVDIEGRICLVTGANSGIGRAVARALARKGATVWLLCRDPERGREAETALRAETGNERVHFAALDLADLESVRSFAESFPEDRVDVLIHNAGVLPSSLELTRDGIERTLATNVVGPFLLTHLLEPRLLASGQSRVVFVSSGGMYTRRLSLRDLEWQERAFDGVVAYAQTKRVQVILAELFAERWGNRGIVAHAMHPGWADTPGVQTSLPGFRRIMQRVLRSAEQGADTVIWLAVATRAAERTGRFWFDRAERCTHYLPHTREAKEDRDRLWDLCSRLSGLESAGPQPELDSSPAALAATP
jgi:NAD(P)-dependent dehydrogenase (short-subunit alcohol dehydrogenase family)